MIHWRNIHDFPIMAESSLTHFTLQCTCIAITAAMTMMQQGTRVSFSSKRSRKCCSASNGNQDLISNLHFNVSGFVSEIQLA